MNNINIDVRFVNGRCFFNGFDTRNDKDPNTGKAGVNYYQFYLIGLILEKLGFARRIHCFENGASKVIFLNTKSFLKWRERHSKDEYITLSDEINDEESRKRQQKVLSFGDDFERSIKFIIKSFEMLSYEEVIKKAQTELPENEDKKRKIRLIKGILNRHDYDECYQMKKVLEISLTRRNQEERDVCEFLSYLPGIDVCAEK